MRNIKHTGPSVVWIVKFIDVKLAILQLLWRMFPIYCEECLKWKQLYMKKTVNCNYGDMLFQLNGLSVYLFCNGERCDCYTYNKIMPKLWHEYRTFKKKVIDYLDNLCFLIVYQNSSPRSPLDHLLLQLSSRICFMPIFKFSHKIINNIRNRFTKLYIHVYLKIYVPQGGQKKFWNSTWKFYLIYAAYLLLLVLPGSKTLK